MRVLRWKLLRDLIVLVRNLGNGCMPMLDRLFDRLASSKDGAVGVSYFLMQFTAFLAVNKFDVERPLLQLFAAFDLGMSGEVDVRDMQCAFRYAS